MAQAPAGFVSDMASVSPNRGIDARERLAPARGILLGLTISSAFWAGLAVWALA